DLHNRGIALLKLTYLLLEKQILLVEYIAADLSGVVARKTHRPPLTHLFLRNYPQEVTEIAGGFHRIAFLNEQRIERVLRKVVEVLCPKKLVQISPIGAIDCRNFDVDPPVIFEVTSHLSNDTSCVRAMFQHMRETNQIKASFCILSENIKKRVD